MTVLSVLATISGAMIAVAYIPQAYRIFTRKSAKDVSIISYSLFLLGAIIWLLYGLEIQNAPVIISQSIGILCILTVLIGYHMYK